MGSERFLFDTMAWNLSGFSIILFVLSHLWQYCFVALIYVWIVADVFASILIMRFIGPFRALCVCVCVCVCVCGGGGYGGLWVVSRVDSSVCARLTFRATLS